MSRAELLLQADVLRCLDPLPDQNDDLPSERPARMVALQNSKKVREWKQ